VTKKTVEIRVRATVEEGSVEEKLLAFLDDEAAIPFKKSEMWMKAAKMCWLSLALKYKKCSQEEVEESLYDCDYSWELHWEFLLNKARMRLARIRHRVYAVNPSVGVPDTQMERTSCHADNWEKNSSPFNSEPDSRAISGQASNSSASEELESGAVPRDKDNSEPFNLFGNSIISKQGSQHTKAEQTFSTQVTHLKKL
jgi:hypothetical protein